MSGSGSNRSSGERTTVTATGPPAAPGLVDGHSVLIDVPATPRSLRLIRLAAADSATDLGFDVDSIESARIAVDELSAVLLDTGDWSRLVLRLDRADGVLTVTGRVTGRSDGITPIHVDRVVQELLSTCVLDYRVHDNGPHDNGPHDNGPHDNGPHDNGPGFVCSIGGRSR